MDFKFLILVAFGLLSGSDLCASTIIQAEHKNYKSKKIAVEKNLPEYSFFNWLDRIYYKFLCNANVAVLNKNS